MEFKKKEFHSNKLYFIKKKIYFISLIFFFLAIPYKALLRESDNRKKHLRVSWVHSINAASSGELFYLLINFLFIIYFFILLNLILIIFYVIFFSFI